MDLAGWKCPKCQRILSPFVPSCPYCLPKEAVIAKVVKGKSFKVKKLKTEPVEEPKVQLSNEIFAEWVNGPAEGGGN